MENTSEKKENAGKILTLEDKKFIEIDQLRKDEKKAAIKALTPDELVKYRKFRDAQRLAKAQEVISRIKSKERKEETRFKIMLGGWLIQKAREIQKLNPKATAPLVNVLKYIQEELINFEDKKELSWNTNLPTFIDQIKEWDRIHHEKFLKKLEEEKKKEEKINRPDQTA